MCGICGLYNYATGQPADPALVRAMTASITHRGPDEDGFHLDGGLAMGMRRLSIIDLAGGRQPISNEDGSIVTVFNGEIYNYHDLRRELEPFGHRFRTRTDTETIVHAYEQWGFDSLSHLNGMFGVAIWDSRRRSLIVARDPFGIKPLYYWDDGESFVFGSEIRAILCHPRVGRVLDRRALDQFLALTYVPSPLTAFENIRKVAPGHAVVCGPEGVAVRRYHSAIPTTLSGRSERDIVVELRERIRTAVRRQMVADVPIGAMLSGGVDSSAIAYLMTESSDGPISTFTVGFAGDFVENELELARAESRRIGSRHFEVIISSEEFTEFFPKSIWHLEEPVATASTFAYYKVCELARGHVKVVLTGQGADEPFAGYDRYLGEHYGRWFRAIPAAVREGLIAPIVRNLPRNEKLKRAMASLGEQDAFNRMLAIYTVCDIDARRRLYRNGDLPETDFDLARAWLAEVQHLENMNQLTYLDARLSLPDNLLLYGDKMSMAVSLEARVPFLDLELIALAESIPAGMKVHGRTLKHILKRAVADWVPRETITRRKIGFATPIDQWFRGSMQETLKEMLLDTGDGCAEYFNLGTIEAMLAEHASGRHDHKRILFSLLTFQSWHDQFIRPPTWTGRAR